jgi:hypothetical protein
MAALKQSLDPYEYCICGYFSRGYLSRNQKASSSTCSQHRRSTVETYQAAVQANLIALFPFDELIHKHWVFEVKLMYTIWSP